MRFFESQFTPEGTAETGHESLDYETKKRLGIFEASHRKLKESIRDENHHVLILFGTEILSIHLPEIDEAKREGLLAKMKDSSRLLREYIIQNRNDKLRNTQYIFANSYEQVIKPAKYLGFKLAAAEPVLPFGLDKAVFARKYKKTQAYKMGKPMGKIMVAYATVDEFLNATEPKEIQEDNNSLQT